MKNTFFLIIALVASGVSATENLMFSFISAVERYDEQEVERILKQKDFDPNVLWKNETLAMYCVRLLAQERETLEKLSTRGLKAGGMALVAGLLSRWAWSSVKDAQRGINTLPADRAQWNQWLELQKVLKPAGVAGCKLYGLWWLMPLSYDALEKMGIVMWHRFSVVKTRLRIFEKVISHPHVDLEKKSAQGQTLGDLLASMIKSGSPRGYLGDIMKLAAAHLIKVKKIATATTTKV